ncbi:MAG TPA: Ig-like domain-containing protein, partial [Ktedonobacterales bacterium]|nr:Ig-like domain-containing protein [Ktedonobacterales bacterium]
NAGSPVAVSTAAGVTSASFSTAALATGTHTIIAIYSGDANFTSSFASVVSKQTVAKASTGTVVSSSVNPSIPGQTVTFTAMIEVQSPGSGTPTGTVQFQIDGSNVGNPVSVTAASGVVTASFSTSALAVGSHTVTAIYSGDDSFAGNSSTLLAGQTVNMISTNLALISSASQLVSGQFVTFTAILGLPLPGAGPPTGSIQFQIDGSTVGSPVNVSTVNGVTTASFSTTLAAGVHAVIAIYSGDSNVAGSSGSITQTVAQASTNLTVSTAANPSFPGQNVTFTATITIVAPGSGTPTGTVQFQIDGSNAGSPVAVSTVGGITTATFSTTTLTPGSHTITASYSGDTNASASTAPAITQVIAKATTSTTLAASLAATVAGQSITFTATVSSTSPGTPTGVVIFSDGSTSLGQGTLNTVGGTTTATFTTSSLAVGSHTLTASYSGDGTNTASTSTALTQLVAKASSTTTLAASANPSGMGQNVTFTATITILAPGSGTPTGTVQFQIDGSNAGSPVAVSTVGGITTASFSSSSLSVGSHTITASYSGDGNLTASSGPLAGGEIITGGAVGNVTATLDPATGLLHISGDGGNNVLTISQAAAGGLQIAGVSTTVNQSANPQTFNLVTGLTIFLLNGNDSVTLSKFSLPGSITISTGTGTDVLSLDTILANALSLTTAGPGKDTIKLTNTSSNSLIVSAGDNAGVALNGVSSSSIKLTAGSNALLSVLDTTSASDLSITLGDNAQGVTVK